MSDEVSNPELIIRRAMFGKQVDQFMVSDIGRYLMARAVDETESAIAEFKKCDAANVEGVRRIQTKMQLAEQFQSWLSEAVTDGLQALNILEDRE